MSHIEEMPGEERPGRGETEPAGPVSPALSSSGTTRRAALVLAGVVAVVVVGWALVSLAVDRAGLAVVVPVKLRGAEEAASALARLFGALILSFYPADEDFGRRLHWIAAGLAVLGVGHLNFGYLEPLIPGVTTPLNEAIYEGLLVRTLAAGLFVVGIVPASPPRLSWRGVITVLLLPVVVYAIIFDAFELWTPLPALTTTQSVGGTADPLGLTAWHWVFSALPLGLAVVAAIGAFRRSRRGELGSWLLLAMVLMASSQLHNALWPSPYGSPVLTSADLLRLCFAGVVAVGGILELQRISSERAVLLATEKERTRRLEEFQAMRADLTSMIVHELGAPVSAIRSLSRVLAKDSLDTGSRVLAADAIQSEAEALRTMIADVGTAAAAERDDFAVEPRPIPLGEILDSAATFAETLPGSHAIRVKKAAGVRTVLADRERIGQVLRNLLSNAAKYSPEGAPIEMYAQRVGEGRARIEVSDEGPGIHPDDVRRIFEKFGRGRDREGRKVPGVGLGLYLSRRIVRAHGSELTVDSAPGEGSVFGFDLEVAG